MEFLGFIRPDGSVGARNSVLIISADPGVDRLCVNVADSVLGAVPVQCWPEKNRSIEIFSDLVKNPNVAGAVVVEPVSGGAGEMIIDAMAQMGRPAELITVSGSGGIIEANARAVRSAMLMTREASTLRRQATLLSRLMVGLIYEGNSGTGDLLYYCVNSLVENNGRVVIAKRVADKKDKINKCPVVKKLGAGGKVDRDRGLYEIECARNQHDTLIEMAAKGVQLVVAASGGPYPAAHSIVPVINVTASKNYYESLRDNIEIYLDGLDYERFKAEDFSLLIVNEIIATASGKLTKAEILKF